MSNLPLTEQHRIVAKKWVDAAYNANKLKELKSNVLAAMMIALGDMPVSRAEMQVKASAEWKEYVEGLCDAERQENLLRVQLKNIEMQHRDRESEAATRRAEMRL